MRYINKDDCITVIQERLLDESVQLDEGRLDKIEANAIDLVVSYISGRYDCAEIFADPVKRNGILVQIIAMITAYRAVRRNAARKVPDDYPDLYKEAIKMLENIQAGSQKLNGLPEITGASGTSGSLMYGNNTNDDFYI